MAQATKRLGEIKPARCRDSAQERFDVTAVAATHERAHREVIAGDPKPTVMPAPEQET